MNANATEPNVEQEIKNLEESKKVFDKWHKDIAEWNKPLKIENGKIVQGCYWIGLKAEGKVKKKKPTASQSLHTWALKMGRQWELSAYDLDLAPAPAPVKLSLVSRVKTLLRVA